ncbi:hypothetical protein D0T51_09805 [Parabacteroides sp. 52]|uniref:tetratricopeptide repeat protein n=1 Tax=unclassified Parabacteroides TaxID=2649774 RepID=UPI0013D2F7DE|nr:MULTISPECIES: tetratricopeptide repeat protein [unclassified Parabacteroides]MDH6535352.1 tetratricopeptide (TPR) repeat protein [Parabacteroides sp. PM5-20]NDV56020.1 hypothetical protein [Parabacteroides sp. 52]
MRFFICLAFFSFLSFTGYSQTYTEWIEKSYDFLEKDDLQAAEESIRAAMRLEPANPNNFALLTNLGTVLRRQGKYDEALVSYNSALSRLPNSIMLLDNRASLYAEMGETEKAIQDYTTLLMLETENQEALYNRGLLFLQVKNFLAAENDFDKLLELNDKTVRGRLGFALLEKMRGNYDESEIIYNYLISKFPRNWNLYEGRADLYFLMGKNARAMADINKIFVESTPTASLHILRGKVKLALYEKEAAKTDFLKAQEMGYDPEVIAELLRMVL